MIEVALRYLKAQKEQGGKVTQWEGNKQTARLYVSKVRKILKAVGKDENELIASLTDENIESVVNENYEASKQMKEEKKEPEVVEVEKKEEGLSEEKELKEEVLDKPKEEEREEKEEVSKAPSEERTEKMTDGREIIRKNIERSIEASKRFVLERKRRENRSVAEREEDEEEKPKAKQSAGLLTSPWVLIGLMSAVLVAVVIVFMTRKKEPTGAGPVSASVAQNTRKPTVPDESTALNDMFGELNRMFGAEMWRP